MKKDLLQSLRDKTTEFFDKLIDDGSTSENLKQEIVNKFHQLYYNSHFFNRTKPNIFWQGIPTEKCPLDLWIYQEIIFEIKPDLIIECGTANGGTTLFLANICDLLNKGKIISVDIKNDSSRPKHHRIEYLLGETTSEKILTQIKKEAVNQNCVLVILDDAHDKAHILKELSLYNEFVTTGSYLIVEDTNLNGHPINPGYGEGPWEAVEEFLKTNKNFETDKRREKFFLSFNPNGYLKKIG